MGDREGTVGGSGTESEARVNIDFLRSLASIVPPLKPALPLGTIVEPFGRVAAVLSLGGERYYHLIDRHGNVSKMPAVDIERMAREQEPGQAEVFDRR